MIDALKKAIEAVGSQTALAKAVNVTPQAVQQWVSNGKVSHKKVIDVERVSGVHRSELRSDLYPKETIDA